jgi:acetamidase/formamidase
MDLRELSIGVTIWLPVEVPGALLSVGDLHAAMGGGEPTSIALEASGAATLRVGLEKSSKLRYPTSARWLPHDVRRYRCVS